MRYLEELCLLGGTAGDEGSVRDFILSHVANYPHTVDALGNVIVEKKGRKTPRQKLMLSAHMDEVGVIITHITDKGFLQFTTVGGIEPQALLGKRVRIGELTGVIGTAPVHLTEDVSVMPKTEQMYIDIGAAAKAEAMQYVSPADRGIFVSDYVLFGDDCIKSKAIDDRFGCAVLLNLLEKELPYDVTLCFCVMEEIGLKGAGAAANRVQPDIALVIESTTANDVCGVEGSERVCVLGEGAAVSFMDRATVYDKTLYTCAMSVAQKEGIKVQTKTKVAGGNDAAAIQSAGAGAKVLAISVPTRYIHSASCVAKKEDMDSVYALVQALILYLGEEK
ncbi:MAG: M42 family peptidase [Clostridia bacterium]|nr:M42 family peptidase [Clostridia bacterium]